MHPRKPYSRLKPKLCKKRVLFYENDFHGFSKNNDGFGSEFSWFFVSSFKEKKSYILTS